MFTSAELKGPNPRRVPHTATIENRNVVAVAPREPKRTLAQTMSGTIVKLRGIEGIVEYTAGVNTTAQATVIANARATSSRGPPTEVESGWRSNDTNSGVTIRAPEASPSHQVFHTSP